jgi:hypothetical protein
MAIIDTWCPPSREHWQLVTFLWQFFPMACTLCYEDYMKTLAKRDYTDHAFPMAFLILPYGQDIYPVSIQRTREDWMGNNGSTRVHNAVVHYVLLANTGRD